MNPDNQPNTSQNISATAPSQTPGLKSNLVQTISMIKDKIPQPAKDAFAKFYSNKMIFWPITIVFSLLFLTIILGLLFGSKSPTPTKTVSKPTPFVNTKPVETPAGDTLTETQFKLIELKDEINKLDVRQSPIKPPVMDFDIKF